MLIRRRELEAIRRGEITLAFRRWLRPRVRPGTRLRTAVGVLEVLSVDEVQPGGLTDADARAAGLASLAVLRDFLSRKPVGGAWRIRLRYGGDDPRVALRRRDRLSAEELAAITDSLERMDRSVAGIGWPRAYLELIEASPRMRAAILAEGQGMEVLTFKRRVRQLKELGLTESLRPGYRLSPRGEALLRALRDR
jgi:hypothetical protein